MKLKTIKRSNAKGFLLLGFAEGEERRVFAVSEAEYRALGAPLVGDELGEEEALMLEELEEATRAKKKALRLLSFGDNSRRALVAKLRRAGISAAAAERAASEVESLGYLDEERQLARLIEKEVNVNLTGPRKFIPKLAARGYPVSKIREAAERLSESGAISFPEARARLVESLGDAGAEEIEKILFKRGF